MDRRRPRRAGFTLVELLVVILIIGALVAILVPTVFAAFRKAREAQVTAEMSNLATALASFKITYGDYPPSRVILCERGFNSLSTSPTATVGSSGTISELPLAPNCTDMTNGQLVQRSLLYLRRFWPRADFLSASPSGQFHDFNGNGLQDPNPIVLTGSECLTFFLGGLPIHGPGNKILGMSGFGKSPVLPFVASAGAGSSGPLNSQNRTVPNYEFNNGRLIDQDGDGIPSYIDPINTSPGLRRPYAYFASYGVNAYDPNDDNGYGHNPNQNSTIPPLDQIYELEDDTTTFVERGFLVGYPVYDGTATPAGLAVSPGPNPYTSGPAANGNIAYFNPTSFQIICAGQDGLWGLGGTYNNTVGGAQGRLPALSGDAGIVNAQDTSNGVRAREADNLTNFSGGRLD